MFLLLIFALLALSRSDLINANFDDTYTKIVSLNFDDLGEVPVRYTTGKVLVFPWMVGKFKDLVFKVPLRPFADGQDLLDKVVNDLNERYPEHKFQARKDSSVTKEEVENLIHRFVCWTRDGAMDNFLEFEPDSWSGYRLIVDFAIPALTPGEVKCAEIDITEARKRADSFGKFVPNLYAVAEKIGLTRSLRILQKETKPLELSSEAFFDFVKQEIVHWGKLKQFSEEFVQQFTFRMCELQEAMPHRAAEIEAIIDMPIADLTVDTI